MNKFKQEIKNNDLTRRTITVLQDKYVLADNNQLESISTLLWSCVSLIWYHSHNKLWFVTHLQNWYNAVAMMDELKLEIKNILWNSSTLYNFHLTLSWWNNIMNNKIVNPWTKNIWAKLNSLCRKIDTEIHLWLNVWNRIKLILETWEIINRPLRNKNK